MRPLLLRTPALCSSLRLQQRGPVRILASMASSSAPTSDVPHSRNPAVHDFLISQHLQSSIKVAVGAAAALSVAHFALDPVTRVATLGSAVHSLSLVWLGGAGVISFMEAPVKFQAPSVTRSVGLDVGRHVFSALNKLEVPAACALTYAWAMGATSRAGALALVPAACVALETAVLLPSLFDRAKNIIAGKPVPKSKVHAAAAVSAMVKLGSLLALAWLVK